MNGLEASKPFVQAAGISRDWCVSLTQIFDPTFDHHYGTHHPPKVVQIPIELHEKLKIFLNDLNVN